MSRTKRTSKNKINSTNAILFVTASGLIYLLYSGYKNHDKNYDTKHDENHDTTIIEQVTNHEYGSEHPPLDLKSIEQAHKKEITVSANNSANNNPTNSPSILNPFNSAVYDYRESAQSQLRSPLQSRSPSPVSLGRIRCNLNHTFDKIAEEDDIYGIAKDRNQFGISKRRISKLRKSKRLKNKRKSKRRIRRKSK